MGKAIMAAAVLLGIGCTGATEVLSGGRTLFRSAGRVTYGAVYSGRAVKASVAAEAAGRVTMFAGREPVTVFLGGEALGRGAWEYDAAAESVTLSVPAGRSELQIRFDGLASLAPVRVSIPVSLVVEGTDRVVGAMAAEMADERLSGRFAWPGPEGFYDLEARLGEAAVAAVAVRVQGAAEAAQSFLTPGSVLVLDADAPGQELPADAVRCRLQRPVTAARRLARDAVSWDRAVLVEGEAFREEGGGQVRVSNEHGNTHGGGCVYAWADAGHWLAWDLPVPASGRYTLGFVVASQEERVLRSLEIDDLPAPGAAVVSFAGTGGWGRVNAEEWQLFQVVDSEGRPVVLEWGEGTHRLRLTNLLGQHMNVDCILLLPLR